MLTQTSEIGINTLIYLARLDSWTEPVTPRQIADAIGTSPTYTAKVCSLLVKADILRSQRGAQGGVVLAHQPSEVSLLDIVEACQGRILPEFSHGTEVTRQLDTLNLALRELHSAVTGVLRGWTLQELSLQPSQAEPNSDNAERGRNKLREFLDSAADEEIDERAS